MVALGQLSGTVSEVAYQLPMGDMCLTKVTLKFALCLSFMARWWLGAPAYDEAGPLAQYYSCVCLHDLPHATKEGLWVIYELTYGGSVHYGCFVHMRVCTCSGSVCVLVCV